MLTVPLQSSTVVGSQSSKLDVVSRPDIGVDRDSIGSGSSGDDTTCFDATGCDGDRPLLSSTTSATTVQLVAVITIDFRFVAPLVLLVLFNLVVIIGNSLVVAAVFTSRKLRTVTNVFIVSLAMSDLLLGLLVLPSSSGHELLGTRWPFGNVWCQAWLAIDVWLCTASILNLCAISFDRYLAISRPFRYPTLMSPFRAKIAVVLVWTTALAICMPPLLGWRDSGGSIASSPTTTTMMPSTATTQGSVRGPMSPTRLRFEVDPTVDLLGLDNTLYAQPAPRFGKATDSSVGYTGSNGLRHRDSIADVVGRSPGGILQRSSTLGTISRELVRGTRVPPSETNEILEAGVFSGDENSSSISTPPFTSSTQLSHDPSIRDKIAEYATDSWVVPHISANISRPTALLPTELPILYPFSSADSSFTRNVVEIASQRNDDQQSSTTPTWSRSKRSVSQRPSSSRVNSTHDGDIFDADYIDDEEDYTADSPDSITISVEYMQCALTSDPGYIVYSACGSFWIPMFIMVSFYVRIYRTAVRATNALRRGVLTTKTGSVIGHAASADSSVNLRIHRGGGGQANPVSWARASIRFSTSSSRRESSTDTLPPRNHARKASERGPFNLHREQPIVLSTQSSCCDSVSGNESATINAAGSGYEDCGTVISNASAAAIESDYFKRRFSASNSGIDCQKCMTSGSSATGTTVANGRRMSRTSDISGIGSRLPKRSENGTVQLDSAEEVMATGGGRRFNRNPHQQQQPIRLTPVSRLTPDSKQRASVTSLPMTSGSSVARTMRGALLTSRNDSIDTNDDDDDDSTSPRRSSRCGGSNGNGSDSGSGGIEVLLRSALTPVYEHCPAVAAEMRGSPAQSTTSRRGLLNIKTQLSRLNREKKAAKTVGIIVGCFVFCWAPFFTVYVLGAFCNQCTPSVVFSVFFWLGYCNSAINPFVYALCSNDFRDAFRRLLRCGRVGPRRNNNGGHPGGVHIPMGDAGYGLVALVRGLRGPGHQNRWNSGDESGSSSVYR